MAVPILPALLYWQVCFSIVAHAKPVMNIYVSSQYLRSGRATAPFPPVKTMKKIADQAAADINAGGNFAFDVNLIHAKTDLDSLDDTIETLGTNFGANQNIHGIVGFSDKEHLSKVSSMIRSLYGVPILAMTEFNGQAAYPNVFRLKTSDGSIGAAIARFIHLFEWRTVVAVVDEHGSDYYDGAIDEVNTMGNMETWHREDTNSMVMIRARNIPRSRTTIETVRGRVVVFMTKVMGYINLLHSISFSDWSKSVWPEQGTLRFHKPHYLDYQGWNWAFFFVDEGVGLAQLTKGFISVTGLTYLMDGMTNGIYDQSVVLYPGVYDPLNPEPLLDFQRRAQSEVLSETVLNEFAASFVFRNKQVTDAATIGISGQDVSTLTALKEHAEVTVWRDNGVENFYLYGPFNFQKLMSMGIPVPSPKYRDFEQTNYLTLDPAQFAVDKDLWEEGTFFLYDAIYAHALAMKEVLKSFPNALTNSLYGDTDVLEEYQSKLKQVNFEGATGKFQYDANGNRDSVIEVAQWPLWRGSVEPVVAEYTTASGFQFLDKIEWFNPNSARPNPIPPAIPLGVLYPENLTSHTMDELKALQLVPTMIQPNCPAGEAYAATRSVCFLCAPGTYLPTPSLSEICNVCEPGKFQPERGSSACMDCPVGKASNAANTGCDVCPEGTFAEQGFAACMDCPLGKYAESNTSSLCEYCPLLEYQAQTGQTGCNSCPEGPGFVTLGIGSTSPADCVCKPTEYFPCLSGDPDQNVTEACSALNYTDTSLKCTACPNGFDCLGGVRSDSEPVHQQPMVPKGRFALQSDPYSAYDCMDAFELCVGGETGSPDSVLCAGKRYGLQCARCPDGYSSFLGEPCKSCSALGENIGNLGMFVGLMTTIAICALSYWAATTPARFSPAFAFCGILGTSIVYAQIFANLGSIIHPLVGPFGDIVEFLQFTLLDLRQWNIGCVTGNSLLSNYIMRNMVPAVVLIFFAILWAMSTLLNRLLPAVPAVTARGCCSAIMMLWTTFSLAIVKSVVYPLACRDNPNSIKTRLDFEGYECSQSTVADIIGFMIFFVLLYVIFPALVCYGAMAQAPNLYHVDDGFRSRFEFMFSLWKPRLWFWSCGIVGRNAIMALLPLFIMDSGIVLVGLFLVEALSFISFATYFPVRERSLGFFHLMLGLTFLAAVVLSLLEVPAPLDSDFSLIGAIFLVAFGAGVASWGLIVMHLFLLSFGYIKGGPTFDTMVHKLFRLALRMDEYMQLDRDAAGIAMREVLRQVPSSEASAWKWSIECLDYAMLGTTCQSESSSLKGIKPKLSDTAKRLSQKRPSRMSAMGSSVSSGSVSS